MGMEGRKAKEQNSRVRRTAQKLYFVIEHFKKENISFLYVLNVFQNS